MNHSRKLLFVLLVAFSILGSLDQVAGQSGAPLYRPAAGRVIVDFASSRETGINIEAPQGAPVRAVENGVVIYVGNGVEGYGNLILVRHANNYVSAYAHLQDTLVVKGNNVSRGDKIATIGMTGDVSRPQLHFELREGATPVDPVPFLAPDDTPPPDPASIAAMNALIEGAAVELQETQTVVENTVKPDGVIHITHVETDQGQYSEILEPGKRGVSFSVAESSASGGLVPNDHVDILVAEDDGGTQTRPLLFDVKVLMFGTRQGQSAETGYQVAIVELTPEDAERVTNAAQTGTLSLVLHGATGDAPDRDFDPSDPALVAKIQRGLVSLGFLHGAIDGIGGAVTAKAIRNFEVYYNYEVTGHITEGLLDRLVAAGAAI